MFGGDSTHMPLKINTAGVIPPDFCQLHLAGAGDHRRLLGQCMTAPAWVPHWLAEGFFLASRASWRRASRSTWSPMRLMIIFFSYFYTAIVFNPEETADNLKKYGGFIPGIRPGC